jgi:hypothetical protein
MSREKIKIKRLPFRLVSCKLFTLEKQAGENMNELWGDMNLTDWCNFFGIAPEKVFLHDGTVGEDNGDDDGVE